MERVLVVSNSNELVRMKPERIAYISSDGNYVTVVLHDRTEHVFAFNLLRMQKLVETQLAEEAACFIRIGKSLIINRNYIYKINLTKQELVLSDSRLDGAFRLSASREALRQLKELLEKEAGFLNDRNDAVIIYLQGHCRQVEVFNLLPLTGDDESWFVGRITSHEAAYHPADELLDDDIFVPNYLIILNANLTLLKNGNLV